MSHSASSSDDYDSDYDRFRFPDQKERVHDIMSTYNRCAAFTVCYGVFLTPEEHQRLLARRPSVSRERSDEDEDFDYQQSGCHREFLEYLRREQDNPDIAVIIDMIVCKKLPCCWPDNTRFDSFIGFPIVPIYWGRRDEPETITGEIADYVRVVFENAPTWEDCLSFDTYERRLDGWRDEIFRKYANEIAGMRRFADAMELDPSGLNLWMFPSDCASCS